MIKDWAEERAHQIEVFKAYEGELPRQDSFDLLVILGGPMSVNDTFDWLEAEKAFVKKSIDNGCLVLGICLGAQMIAKVLGKSVYPNSTKEIGWFPISCSGNFLKDELKVLHWHGETFDLPDGAELLASSPVCKNQAFAYEDTVLGLQFHLEMDERAICEIIENCKHELVESEYVQSENEIISSKDYLKACKEELYDLLDGFEMRVMNVA
jgi:GMP synthase-like glutamine amidotransferase